MILFSVSDDKEKLFSNFDTYVLRFKDKIYLKTGQVRCIECEGSGWIYNPNDPRCPVEGNKMRGTIPCTQCKGTKIGNLKDWKANWKADKKEHNEDVRRETAIKNKREKILSKLTKADVKFLGLSK